MTTNNSDGESRKRSRIVVFIEYWGKHPFATGLFALIGIAGLFFCIYTTLQMKKDTENLQKTISGLQSAVYGVCKFPPCWTTGEAIKQLLGATKDYVDSKVGPPNSRSASGWHYKVGICPITVHYVNDAVTYFSHPLSPDCHFSWKEMFWIEKQMPSLDKIAIGHLLDGVFAGAYPPSLHIATGCTTCGNWHDPYIEFRVPGFHMSDFLDRYFTTRFDGVDGSDPYDNTRRFEQRLLANTSLDPDGTMEDFCNVDVGKSVEEALRNVRVDRVGYGRKGRQNYPIDVCQDGHVAGPP